MTLIDEVNKRFTFYRVAEGGDLNYEVINVETGLVELSLRDLPSAIVSAKKADSILKEICDEINKEDNTLSLVVPSQEIIR